MQALSPTQEIVVSVEALGWFAPGTYDLGLLQFWRDCGDNSLRHSVLQVKNVFEGAIETIRPQMRSVGGIYKLRGDTHPVRSFPHAAFKDVAHSKFAPDLLHIHSAAFVGEARIAGDNEQAGKPRQGRNDVLYDAIGKVLLLGIATHVLEWQDCDGGAIW